MSREEFLRQLEQELRGLSTEERENAMRYYRDYLSEADDVQAAIDGLGSPKKVAADILREFGAVPAQRSATQRFSDMDRGQKALLLLLIVIAAVCILPASMAGLGGLIGILVGILAVVCVGFLLFLCLFVAFFIAAVACLIQAILTLSTAYASALLLLGAALLLFGLAQLSLAAFLWMCRTLFPSAIRGIAALGRRIFHPRGGAV